MQSEEKLRKTALFDTYGKYGGKVIDFAGWALPVQFSGLKEEHMAVRKAAGLFDVSHMGEVVIRGKDAEGFLEYLLTNGISVMKDNQISYNLMCYENGTVVDDLIVYKYHREHFYLVINAGNIEKDVAWIHTQAEKFQVKVEHISSQVSQLALQGPLAEQVLQKLTDYPLGNISFFCFADPVMISGVPCLVSRSGYTGEDGFELYMPNQDAAGLWDAILEAGQEEGVMPCGLGCRDTLRFEAGLPLYGNELSDSITPLEAGLGFFVKLDKGDFIGREALIAQKVNGLERKIAGFEMIGKGIPRHDYEVYSGEEKIGFVTTGYLSPSLDKTIGLAMLDSKFTEIGTPILVKIRNKKVEAVVIHKKFLEKNYKK